MEDATKEAPMTLRDTIIPKSDQINYDDVASTPLAVRVVGMAKGSAEQPVIVRIADDATGTPLRDYKPSKSMRRVLIAAWGDKGKDWIGKRVVLVGNPNIAFGGAKVGGIEVSHVSGIDAPMSIMLATSRSKRREHIVQPLKG